MEVCDAECDVMQTGTPFRKRMLVGTRADRLHGQEPCRRTGGTDVELSGALLWRLLDSGSVNRQAEAVDGVLYRSDEQRDVIRVCLAHASSCSTCMISGRSGRRRSSFLFRCASL